jgi:hypothetical protein
MRDKNQLSLFENDEESPAALALKKVMGLALLSAFERNDEEGALAAWMDGGRLPKAEETRMPALARAAASLWVGLVERMLADGANPLAHGADGNFDPATGPLQAAIGASAWRPAGAEDTAATEAARAERAEAIVRALVKAGASPWRRESPAQEIPAHLALRIPEGQGSEPLVWAMIEESVARGLDESERARAGDDAFFKAALREKAGSARVCAALFGLWRKEDIDEGDPSWRNVKLRNLWGSWSSGRNADREAGRWLAREILARDPLFAATPERKDEMFHDCLPTPHQNPTPTHAAHLAVALEFGAQPGAKSGGLLAKHPQAVALHEAVAIELALRQNARKGENGAKIGDGEPGDDAATRSAMRL